jgi:hypothetical protein
LPQITEFETVFHIVVYLVLYEEYSYVLSAQYLAVFGCVVDLEAGIVYPYRCCSSIWTLLVAHHTSDGPGHFFLPPYVVLPSTQPFFRRANG